MAQQAQLDGRPKGSRWRIIGWSIAAGLILLPLVAMRFTSEVNWTVSDFLFALLLIGSVGLAYELAVRVTSNIAYRAGIGAALAGAFLLIWVNGAVGMIGSEANPYNLLFGGVILIALAGAIVARFQARGMVWAMGAAAVAQAVIGLVGLASDPLGGTLSTAMAAIWVLAALLFQRAARQGDSA